MAGSSKKKKKKKVWPHVHLNFYYVLTTSSILLALHFGVTDRFLNMHLLLHSAKLSIIPPWNNNRVCLKMSSRYLLKSACHFRSQETPIFIASITLKYQVRVTYMWWVWFSQLACRKFDLVWRAVACPLEFLTNTVICEHLLTLSPLKTQIVSF